MSAIALTLAQYLVTASALVIFALGAVHLLLTFTGSALQPRDEALMARMHETSPKITRQTSMWKAWVGFNASHSFGALLFGSVYAYLALVHGPLLFASPYLLGVGLVLLCGYAFLGKRYWFSTPYRGILLATALYIAALIASGV